MSERGPASPSLLVPMSCPGCGRELLAAKGDLLAICPDCPKAYHLGSTFTPYDFQYLKAEISMPGELRYLPFWRVKGALELSGPPAKLSRYRSFPRADELYFPAFWRPRLNYFDDITWQYTRLKKPPETEWRIDPVGGGVRDPKNLPEIARLTLLGYLDRIEDVRGIEARFEIEGLVYVGVPFYKAEGTWADAICGIKVPASVFGA